MSALKFYNKDKSLTAYSFICGYVQRIEKDDKFKELYMEHSHYHVRSGRNGEQVSVWEVFSHNELTKARKLFKSINL